MVAFGTYLTEGSEPKDFALFLRALISLECQRGENGFLCYRGDIKIKHAAVLKYTVADVYKSFTQVKL